MSATSSAARARAYDTSGDVAPGDVPLRQHEWLAREQRLPHHLLAGNHFPDARLEVVLVNPFCRIGTGFSRGRKRGLQHCVPDVAAAHLVAAGQPWKSTRPRGGRLIKHARYYWLLLAESHLTKRLLVRCCNGSGRCRCRPADRQMNEAHGPKARRRGDVSVRCTGADPIPVDPTPRRVHRTGFNGLDGRRSPIRLHPARAGVALARSGNENRNPG